VWSVLNGTVVNVIAVAVGSLIGLSASARIPERYRDIVLASLGLVTVTLGVDAAVLRFADLVAQFKPLVRAGETYGARAAMVTIGSLIIGALLGTWWRLQDRIESIGVLLNRRFAGGGDAQKFVEGFLTASVIFCVGPLTLLGCLRNGLHGDPSYLYIKSLLDGFCSLALASTLGWGVFASVLTVGLFQGGLAIAAHVAAEPLSELGVGLMTAVGGLVLLATALVILDIKKIPVANMLPAIFLPPLIIGVAEWLSPGLLLPVAQ